LGEGIDLKIGKSIDYINSSCINVCIFFSQVISWSEHAFADYILDRSFWSCWEEKGKVGNMACHDSIVFDISSRHC
jgi:hypothetical protein